MSELRSLCIISPDSLYALLLEEAKFPTFQQKVFRSISDIELSTEFLKPEFCLIFGSHFSRLELAEVLLYVRARFRTSIVLQVEGVRDPRVSQVWPKIGPMNVDSESISFNDVESLDLAIQEIADGRKTVMGIGQKLTKSQVGVLAAIAAGKSNPDIAAERGTTIRAVENLVKRTFIRIGETDNSNARARTVMAQKYLMAMGIL